MFQSEQENEKDEDPGSPVSPSGRNSAAVGSGSVRRCTKYEEMAL